MHQAAGGSPVRGEKPLYIRFNFAGVTLQVAHENLICTTGRVAGRNHKRNEHTDVRQHVQPRATTGTPPASYSPGAFSAHWFASS